MEVKKKDNLKVEISEINKNISKFPFVDLSNENIPVDVLKEIPEEAAIFYKFVPINKQKNVLEVGMLSPDNLKAKEALRFITQRSGLETKIFAIDENGLKNILKQYRTFRGEVKEALYELEKELESEEKIKLIKRKERATEEATQKIITDTPVTKIVAVILKHAIEGKASDVHIEPVGNEVKVRFRVDGVLYTSLILPKEIQLSIISRIKILSDLKIDETRVPQDGRFHAVIDGNQIDFRVSTFPVSNGEKVVLRVLDSTSGIKSFEDLGLQGDNLKLLETSIENPFGMILITGPTGSGKTTTLYSILNKLNQESVNIVSLEDPVEYFVKGINQSQVRPEIEYTFASGLRHILRQDPDIIMVGEIRDKETAGLAIHAALTGHILLSTLHTNNVLGVVPRLIDMEIEQFLLPSSLNLAIAQRLIRRLCSDCKKEVIASAQITQIIKDEIDKLSPEQRKEFSWQEPFKIYQTVGCKTCGEKGTKGRIALYEMLKMTSQLEEIINKEATEIKIEEEFKRQGMITMKQDGIKKVLQGIISFEEMIKKVEGDQNI